MEVANTVASIISALGNGKDLLRRMIGKKSKHRGRKPTMSEEEAWLQESLNRRSQEVQASFSNSVAWYGRKFEKGDSTAHSSLAHTLLVLNAGLVNLINTVLHGEAKHDSKSSQALLQLSNNAARDTINALSQLSLRLSNSATKLNSSGRKQEDGSRKENHIDEKSRAVVRGAWIRPKSRTPSGASSEISIAPQKSGKASKSRRPHSKEPAASPSPRRASTEAIHIKNEADVKAVERVPSMLLVPSTLFLPDSHEATPRSSQSHARPRNHQPRARPPSAITFMTSSTKIGEIVPTQQQHRTSYPRVDDANMVEYLTEQWQEPEAKPRKLRRGFRFWKHNSPPASVVAA